MLKAQDLVFLLKVATLNGEKWTFGPLSHDLVLSASEVHAAYKRCVESHLINPSSRVVLRQPLLEVLLHGVRYIYPASLGPWTRGFPTASAAPPLKNQFIEMEEIPVWPHPEGTVRGPAVPPLYKTAPDAALKDEKLYECLALVDTLRVGGARERRLAEQALTKRLSRSSV